MGDTTDILKNLALFSSLSTEELEMASEIMERAELEPGTVIFTEGEPGGSVYVIVDGVVEITTRVTPDVDKTLVTLRAGGIFGELSLVSGEARTASAKALEKTALLSTDTQAFERLIGEHPAMGRKLLQHLLNVIAGRLSATTELYRRAVEWGLSIGGIIEMNFSELIADQIEVTIELATGTKLRGTLLKVEKGPVGYELLVKTGDGQLLMIPYHAVVVVSFAETSAEAESV